MVDDLFGRQKGGVARRDALDPARRSEIARKAAESRWSENTPKSHHTGELKIGDLSLPCAVLPDGLRVLSQRGVGRALGRTFGGKNWAKPEEDGADVLPFYLNLKSLKPFIPNDLLVLISEPHPYRHGMGGGVAQGLVATALPQVCNVWLRAREAGKLHGAQLEVAQRAELLMRGLAEVGIVALIDEATGYQNVRDREALQELLNAYLRKELAAWAKRFPDEFYDQIYRLRGWTKSSSTSSRPQIVAYYTNDIVYARLAPGILEELEKRNPTENGRRKRKHHEWLSDDVGHPALAQHLHAVVTLMRVPEDNDWPLFMKMLDRTHPKRTDFKLTPVLQEAAAVADADQQLAPLPLFDSITQK